VDDEVFKGLKSVMIDGKPLDVLNARFHNGVWLITLQGHAAPEDAAVHVGKTLSIFRDMLPPPAEDEVYWADIEGALVFDEKGREVGKLTGYIETGSHDVFEIQADNGKVYLVSNNPLHVIKIDPAAGTVKIDRIGLVEAN
jgi:16S rRNA processing protein RimM